MEKILNLNSELTKLIHANKLYLGREIEWTSKFNRFGALDMYNQLEGSREYTFFTKPDLNLFADNGSVLSTDAQRNGILYSIYKRYPNMLRQLQHSVGSGPFMNVLTNSIKNTIDLPTITSESMETASTIYGSKVFYRKHSFKSDEAHEISIEFEDTKYLELYAMFKAWDEYVRMRSLGTISAKDTYIQNNILDDQISIYKFIVGADYKTILFYAKLTGCYPTAVPREAFSELNDNKLIYSIPFKTTWVEDMDPLIIAEFNTLTSRLGGDDSPLYNSSLEIPNAEWVTVPYISGSNGDYELRWKS